MHEVLVEEQQEDEEGCLVLRSASLPPHSSTIFEVEHAVCVINTGARSVDQTTPVNFGGDRG